MPVWRFAMTTMENDMSIFGRIKNAIFGQAHAATPASPAPQPSASETTAATPSPSTAQNGPNAAPAPAGTTSAGQASPTTAAPAPTSAAPASPTGGASAGAPNGPVDVEAIMNAAVAKSGQKLDWRHSIVDFMKALGMDASLQERKDLAAELDYTGDMHDSAKMNMFLHKAGMKALAENGGKIPAELMD